MRRKTAAAPLSPSVYSGIRSRWWPMTAATNQTAMPKRPTGSHWRAAYPASAKLASRVSRWSGLAPYQRSSRRMLCLEGQAGDPLGVVHARDGGHDHPGRVSVVGGEIRAVDAQGKQRVRGHDLAGREHARAERAAVLQGLHQDARRENDAGHPGEVAQPDTGPGLVIGRPAFDARD